MYPNTDSGCVVTGPVPIGDPSREPIENTQCVRESMDLPADRAPAVAWTGLGLILAAAAGLVWLVAHMVVMA